jgi:hypothetical protein
MTTVRGNDVNSIQQAINTLEDFIRSNSGLSATTVVMTVSPDSDGIRHGFCVGMVDNSVVDLATPDIGWVGVNAGPDARPSDPILVLGGTPAVVRFNHGEHVTPGTVFYFNPGFPGTFTTTQPRGNPPPPPVGIIYDKFTYDVILGGLAKSLLNGNFAGPPLE